jgi:hypothetical protein
MSTLDNIALAIKKEIKALETSTNGKKITIENDYTDAVTAAGNAKKTALAKLDDDTAKIKKLKKLYQSHTNEAYADEDSEVVTPVKSIPTKAPKAVTVVGSYVEANTNDKKVLFALSQIGSGTKEAIIAKLVELDKTINAPALEQIPSALKSKGVIKSIGKDGKKDIYSI